MHAVKENAAEICASKCRLEDLSNSAGDVKSKQEYDACYSKCVAQETKEVAEEREKVLTPNDMLMPVTRSLICGLC